MKKVVSLVVFTFLFLQLGLAATGSVDSEIQKLTHYAEEYETGNIDYVQLILYVSSVSSGLNEILGATMTEHGDLLKQEQIEAALGEPQDYTKWVWIEGEDHEERLDEEAERLAEDPDYYKSQ